MDPRNQRELLLSAGVDDGLINWYARKIKEKSSKRTSRPRRSESAERSLIDLEENQLQNVFLRPANGDIGDQTAVSIRLLEDYIANTKENIARLEASGADFDPELSKLRGELATRQALLSELRGNSLQEAELPDASGRFVDMSREPNEDIIGRNQSSLQNRGSGDRDNVQSERIAREQIPNLGEPGRPDLSTPEGVREYLATEAIRYKRETGREPTKEVLKSTLSAALSNGTVDPVGDAQKISDQRGFFRRDEKLRAPTDRRRNSANGDYFKSGPASAAASELPGSPTTRLVAAERGEPGARMVYRRSPASEEEMERRVMFGESERAEAIQGRRQESTGNVMTESPLDAINRGLAEGRFTESDVLPSGDYSSNPNGQTVGDLKRRLEAQQPRELRSKDRAEGRAAVQAADRRMEYRFTPTELASMSDRELLALESQLGIPSPAASTSVRSNQEGQLGQRLLALNALAEQRAEDRSKGRAVTENSFVDQFRGAPNTAGGIDWMNRAAVNDFINRNQSSSGAEGSERAAARASSMIDISEVEKALRDEPSTVIQSETNTADNSIGSAIRQREAEQRNARIAEIQSRLAGTEGETIRRNQKEYRRANKDARKQENFRFEEQLPYVEEVGAPVRRNVLRGDVANAGLQMVALDNRGDAVRMAPAAVSFPLPARINPLNIELSREEFMALPVRDRVALLGARAEQQLAPPPMRPMNSTPLIGQLGKALGPNIDLGNVGLRPSQARPSGELLIGDGGYYYKQGDQLIPAGYQSPPTGDVQLGPAGGISPAVEWVASRIDDPFKQRTIGSYGGNYDDVRMSGFTAPPVDNPLNISAALQDLNQKLAQKSVPLPEGGIRSLKQLEDAALIIGAQNPIGNRPRNFAEVMDYLGIRGDAESKNIAGSLYQLEVAKQRPGAGFTSTSRAYPETMLGAPPAINDYANYLALQNQQARAINDEIRVTGALNIPPQAPMINFDVDLDNSGLRGIGNVGRAEVKGLKPALKARKKAFQEAQQSGPRIPAGQKDQVEAIFDEAIRRSTVADAFRALDPIGRIDAELERLSTDPYSADGSRRVDLLRDREELIEAGYHGVKSMQSPLAGVEPGADPGLRDPGLQIAQAKPSSSRREYLENLKNPEERRVRLEGESQPGPFTADRALKKEAELREFARGQQQSPVRPMGGESGPQQPLFGAPDPTGGSGRGGRKPFDRLGVPFVHQDDPAVFGTDSARLGLPNYEGIQKQTESSIIVPVGEKLNPGSPLVPADPKGDRVERSILRQGTGRTDASGARLRSLIAGKAAEVEGMSPIAREAGIRRGLVAQAAREAQRPSAPDANIRFESQARFDMQPGDITTAPSLTQKQEIQTERQSSTVKPEARLNQIKAATGERDVVNQLRSHRDQIINHLKNNKRRYGYGAAAAGGTALIGAGINSLIEREKEKREEEQLATYR